MIEKEILESYINKGMSVKEIAEELNKSTTTIFRYMKKYEIKSMIGSQGARMQRFNENYFENIDCEEKAYWLGFIAADGCIYTESSGTHRLQINLKGSDVDHLNKFQEAIGSKYKIVEKLVKTSPVCQLKVNSKKICNDLRELNVIERKSIIFNPPIIREDLKRHFTRGYWDGDGWIKETKRSNQNGYRYNIGIVGGPNAINYFKESIPTEFSIYKLKYNDNVLSLEASSRSAIIEMYDYLYRDATIYLDRKKDKYENIMSRLAEMQGQ